MAEAVHASAVEVMTEAVQATAVEVDDWGDFDTLQHELIDKGPSGRARAEARRMSGILRILRSAICGCAMTTTWSAPGWCQPWRP